MKDKERLTNACFRKQNDTKNLPKNYSKAIISFIERRADLCRNLLSGVSSFESFLEFLQEKKN